MDFARNKAIIDLAVECPFVKHFLQDDKNSTLVDCVKKFHEGGWVAMDVLWGGRRFSTNVNNGGKVGRRSKNPNKSFINRPYPIRLSNFLKKPSKPTLLITETRITVTRRFKTLSPPKSTLGGPCNRCNLCTSLWFLSPLSPWVR